MEAAPDSPEPKTRIFISSEKLVSIGLIATGLGLKTNEYGIELEVGDTEDSLEITIVPKNAA